MKSLIVILLFIVADQAIGGEYHTVQGTKYWLSHPLKVNYHQAYRHCTLNGMYLVSIHTQENQDAVVEVINRWNSSYIGDAHFWTSGTSLGYPDKEFYWAETGYPVAYSNWVSTSPVNAATRKCIILHGGITHQYRWYDQTCDSAHYYICEDRINVPNIIGSNRQFNQSDK